MKMLLVGAGAVGESILRILQVKVSGRKVAGKSCSGRLRF